MVALVNKTTFKRKLRLGKKNQKKFQSNLENNLKKEIYRELKNND